MAVNSHHSPPLRQTFTNTLSAIGYFESSPTLAIAVSGGADSMALLLLAHEWAEKEKGRVIALTVDHGLRPASQAEAAQVSTWCKTRDIEHHILTAPKDWHPETGIQQKARELRYDLLTSWCKKNRVLHLLTAHHAGDQTETLLFRLARGSFIEGLACIPTVSLRDGVRLIRPLLGFSKIDLYHYLSAENQPWIDDPSNQNPLYTRNRVRAYLSDLPHDTDARVHALTQSLATIRHQLDHRLVKDLCACVDIFSTGHALLKETPFRILHHSQAMKVLSALVQTIGRLKTQPRSEKILLLYHDLLDPTRKRRRALGGCEFFYLKRNHIWRVELSKNRSHISSNTPLKPLAGQAFLGLNGDQFLSHQSVGKIGGGFVKSN